MIRKTKFRTVLAIGTGLVLAMTASTAASAAPAIHQMADLKIAATIPIGKGADWVAISPTSVWIGSKEPNAVSEIDPATSMVKAKVVLPGVPCAGLTINGDSLWVPLCGPVPLLAEVDMTKRALVRLLIVGPPMGEGGITVGAGSLWLINDKVGSLMRIDPKSGAIRSFATLPAGSFNPVFLKDKIFVSQFGGATVSIVDAHSGKVKGNVAVGARPRFITAGADAVWVVSQGEGTLARIGASGDQPATEIPLDIAGAGGDVTFANGRVWATLMGTPLSVVDAASSNILCQWKGPGGDSLGVGHGAVWLTNLKDGTVSRINLADLPADCGVAAAEPPKP